AALARAESERDGREEDAEGGAPTGPFAPGGNRSAMELHEVASDRETDPEPTLGPRRRAVGLAKTLEGTLQKLRLHPPSGVGDADLEVIVQPAKIHGDPPANGSELDRVGDEVPDDLLEAVGISDDSSFAGAQTFIRPALYVLGLGRRPHRLDGRVDHVRKNRGAQLEPELAGDDPGDIEQVVDQLGLSEHVALDDLDSVVRSALIELPGAEQPRPAQNRREGRTQL